MSFRSRFSYWGFWYHLWHSVFTSMFCSWCATTPILVLRSDSKISETQTLMSKNEDWPVHQVLSVWNMVSCEGFSHSVAEKSTLQLTVFQTEKNLMYYDTSTKASRLLRRLTRERKLVFHNSHQQPISNQFYSAQIN